MSLIQIESAQPSMTLAPMPIQITATAAKMVKEAMAEEELANHGLRVGVTGGGCSGLQYLLDFEGHPHTLDFVEHQHGVEVFIDPFSAAHLKGTIIDYVDSLQGSGFKFKNPNIVRACGCGSSFQT